MSSTIICGDIDLSWDFPHFRVLERQIPFSLQILCSLPALAWSNWCILIAGTAAVASGRVQRAQGLLCPVLNYILKLGKEF